MTQFLFFMISTVRTFCDSIDLKTTDQEKHNDMWYDDRNDRSKTNKAVVAEYSSYYQSEQHSRHRDHNRCMVSIDKSRHWMNPLYPTSDIH